jgi:hypothetical protein
LTSQSRQSARIVGLTLAVLTLDGEAILRHVHLLHASVFTGFDTQHRAASRVVAIKIWTFSARELGHEPGSCHLPIALDAVFERIRDTMKYKRRDLIAKHGRIVTPDFEFSVTCEQDRDNPARL